ncbi:hypothetical protein KEM56_007700 [Ascosphaera pollenicola]|nr:hypothetical protein KEM56_007700 [Ascosphaera pollenicola]
MAIKAEEPETIAPSLLLPQTPSPKKRTKPKIEDDESPRKRVVTKVSSSIEEASEEDKLLFRMRNEGKPWGEISEALEDITGNKTGTSTLRMRYAKLKANFTVWNENDASRLLEIGKAIEAEFEREKYGRMAKALAEGGGGTYDAGAVQKKYKELMKNGAFNGLA